MTPEQFLAQIKRQQPAPVYLFLGPESYHRRICRDALIERCLPPEERENGLTRHDLDEVSLSDVIDDARSMSLFAAERLIWISSAESALPRTRGAAAAEGEESGGGGKEGHAAQLAAYVKDPSPGVVLVFEASRYEFDGEDKAKVERVRKFYSAIPTVVEFPKFTPLAAKLLAKELAGKAGLRLGSGELEFLVETLDADALRIAVEIEKLSLYAGRDRALTVDEISAMIPNARAATIFALVNALGSRDRSRSLDLLDTLVREGEYLPLALTFLATQFRLALVAREQKLRSVQEIQSYFSKLGVPMWRQRAEQVQQTMAAFSSGKLRKAIGKTYETDKALRDTRPEDRVILEEYILALTAA